MSNLILHRGSANCRTISRSLYPSLLDRLRRGVFVSLALLIAGCNHSQETAVAAAVPYPKASSFGSGEQIGPEGQVPLRAILNAGALPNMRWPDFSDYRTDVAKFYDDGGDSLPWVREMQPTPQAEAMIAALQNADEKGLRAEDYDGSRWSGRLAQLRPATPNPNESDLIHFDVALTISAMRYISDLHIGRVNPKRLNFGVDVAERRYNLPEFLREAVVDSANVSETLKQVEPLYPGYQRTIQALEKYRDITRLDDGGILPGTKNPIKPGEAYPGVPRLARLLTLVGDLPEGSTIQSGSTFTKAHW